MVTGEKTEKLRTDAYYPVAVLRCRFAVAVMPLRKFRRNSVEQKDVPVSGAGVQLIRHITEPFPVCVFLSLSGFYFVVEIWLVQLYHEKYRFRRFGAYFEVSVFSNTWCY